jgi:hypothetical protein
MPVDIEDEVERVLENVNQLPDCMELFQKIFEQLPSNELSSVFQEFSSLSISEEDKQGIAVSLKVKNLEALIQEELK